MRPRFAGARKSLPVQTSHPDASMLENRSLKLDLTALGLLVLVAFLGVSLATYDPRDPIGQLVPPLDRFYQPDSLVYPPHAQVSNACGWWGAFVADLLLNMVGFGAHYLVLSLAVLDVALLRRRTINGPWLRLAGWLASLIGLAAAVSLLLPGFTAGPAIGPGGYLGVTGRGLLESHFATAGSLILCSSLVVGGLLLCSDYALIRLGLAAVRGTQTVVSRGSRVVGSRRRAELPGDSKDDAAAGARSPVRVRRRKHKDTDEETGIEELDDDEVSLDEDDNLDDEEEEEEELEPVVKERERKKPRESVGRPHFRVRRRFDKQERAAVMSRLEEASQEDPGNYELPDINLLLQGDDVCFDEQVKEVRRKAKILERTFADFGFTVKVVEIETGPVIAQYEVELEAGLRLSRITGLADDLAIALRVPSVRIVAPIPGKNTVGIEVPNEVRQVVRLREVIEESNGKAKKMKVPLFLGKDVSGNPLTVDLSTLPHLLIAGRTGTGKSVCLNAIISSLLMTKRPDEVRLLLIDPKMVELSGYGRLPHLMHPVVTDMRKAEAILAWAVEKMEERYALLARAGVRHITSYNQLGEEEILERLKPETDEERKSVPLNLPFIVIVADEIADLMMTAGKEVEQHIIRLAQKSRAVGIHLILATQKPTVDVITGLIKSNLPARISFQVASRTDSRVVLDEMGADKLLGNGDMLFLWPGTSTLLRGQGTYVTDEEITRIVDAVSTGEQHFVHELVNLQVAPLEETSPEEMKKRDDLYEAAVDIVVREGRGSVSLLQRALGVGYGRAARLIDYMAEDGIVGPYAGSQAREVTINLADWERMHGEGIAADVAAAPRPVSPVGAGSRRKAHVVRLEEDLDDHEPEAEQDYDEEQLWDDEDEEPEENEDEESDDDDLNDESTATDDLSSDSDWDEEEEDEEEYEEPEEDEEVPEDDDSHLFAAADEEPEEADYPAKIS
jgi:S-DNA-T family DNA segregation ATPase FtsK/SpoIIIE